MKRRLLCTPGNGVLSVLGAGRLNQHWGGSRQGYPRMGLCVHTRVG